MSEQQILRYLYLVDRRLYIILNSGINWQPEYGPELVGIDRELMELREVVESAKIKRGIYQTAHGSR